MGNNDETYNGWANRETWAVALHINNDQGWQESVTELLTHLRGGYGPGDAWDAREAGELIRENVEDVFSIMREGDNVDLFDVREDVGSLWRVNWAELGRSFLSDLEEEGEPSSS